jgi:hypothetical protein
VLIVTVSAPARANRGLDSSWLDNPAQPISGKCAAFLHDSDVGNVNYYLWIWVQFQNQTQETVTAAEFQITISDTFGSVLGSVTGEDDGTFSPGVLINPHSNMIGTMQPQFSFLNIWPTASSVQCSIRRVKYIDGTVWSSV